MTLGTKPTGPIAGYCHADLTLVPPARVAAEGDELVLMPETGGERLNVGFPHGWKAWRVGGVAELVSRDGNVVGREGDVLRNLRGYRNDLAWLVCDGGA